MTTASIDALAYIDAPADAFAASLIPAPTSALPAPPIYESLLSPRLQSATLPLPPLSLTNLLLNSPPDDNESIADWTAAYKNTLAQCQAQVFPVY